MRGLEMCHGEVASRVTGRCQPETRLPVPADHVTGIESSHDMTMISWDVARRTRWARLAARPGVTVLTESGSLSPGGNRTSHHDFGASPALYVTVLWPTQCQWHCSMPVSTAQIMMQRVPTTVTVVTVLGRSR